MLSIVCPALEQRRGQWPILDHIEQQMEGHDAELLVYEDQGEVSIGHKMNALYRAATGDYVCTVADDDSIAENYVSSIVDALGRADVVTFTVRWGNLRKGSSSCGYRPLAAVRTELAKQFCFPDWWQTEDRAFNAWLSRKAPSVCHIPDTLYFYNYRIRKPEFGNRTYAPRAKQASGGAVDRHIRAQL